MNPIKELTNNIRKVQCPDGTFKILKFTLPTSDPEKVDEFLKKINQNQNLVPLTSTEATEFAVSSLHKDNEQLKNGMKSLKNSLDELKKVVMSQDQNKVQKDHESDSDSVVEIPSKKTKLEDENEEIQRLNQIIKELKEDAQKQTQIIKNLKEDNFKLDKEVSDLKYGGGQ